MELATSTTEARRAFSRAFLVLGAIIAGLGVAAGAFGAHGLEGQVSPERIDVFETGVFYHLVHALGLLAIGWAATEYPSPFVAIAGWCHVVGIVIFSGSLYLLVLTDTPWLGAVTPIGGVSFIVGWGCLAWGILSSR